jgi:cell division protein FtsQ
VSPARPPAPRPRPPAPRPAAPAAPASATPEREAPAARTPTRPAQQEPPARADKAAAATPTRDDGAAPRSDPPAIPPVRYISSSAATPRAPRAAGPATGPSSVVSTRSVARFAERAKARRNLARRQIAIVVGGALAVLGLAYLLFFSPVLALDPARVHVEGAGTVVAVDQVQAVVAAHSGTPLPRLDTVGLRDKILDVPGVRGARVMRDWPRGIDVTVVAREPVAAVPETGTSGGFALLDEDGVQVGRVDAAPGGLPVVDVPVGDRRTLDAVLTVLHGLPADLLAQVQDVSAHTQDTVTMHLRDGLEVDWGSAKQTPLKVAVLTTLRSSPAAQGAHAIDVSAPTLPITR